MAEKIDGTGNSVINNIKFTQQMSHPASPASGSEVLYVVSGSSHGGLYLKDSGGRQIGPFITGTASSGGAPTDATYVTTSSNGTLSAEIVHPEFVDLVSGSDVDMSGAAVGTGVTGTYSNGCYEIIYSNASFQYWDIDSVIGTGNFDLRMRVVWVGSVNPVGSGANSAPLFYLKLSDSSRTHSTEFVMMRTGAKVGSATPPEVAGILNDVVQGKIVYETVFPVILRISRVGTSVSFYYSADEGRSWCLTGTATSSLNVGKIGALMNPNSQSTSKAIVHWIRSV